MASGVRKTKLGSQGLEVSGQGLGCMTMTGTYYGPSQSESEMIALLHRAIHSGVTFLDTADVYGPFSNEILIGKALKQQQGLREKVQLATKFGIYKREGQRMGEVRGDPEYVRECCLRSLERLQVDCIDLYYVHRIDHRIPIEITMGEMKKLVEEGKIKYVGLAEASASTIRRAHAVHPISVVQIEWSLMARDVEEQIVPTCRQLGIGIVSYSPLGRGFFSAGANLAQTFQEDDFRRCLPRFQPENLEHSHELFRRVSEMAAKKRCSTPQLALAWVHHQGEDACPIPGTTKTENLNQNIEALSIKLTAEELLELESIASVDAVKGDRYPGPVMAYTWKQANTPPMSSWKTT